VESKQLAITSRPNLWKSRRCRVTGHGGLEHLTMIGEMAEQSAREG
jgi:hypothetical protein